jgi:hypothetical protein
MKTGTKAGVVILDSSKGVGAILRDDVWLINLNAYVNRGKFNYTKLGDDIIHLVSHSTTFNLCNLATCCHALGIKYSSSECVLFITRVVKIFKGLIVSPKFVQLGLDSYGEVDCRPIGNLLTKVDDVVYINILLLNYLNMLGFLNNQIPNVVSNIRSFTELTTESVCEEWPLTSEANMENYERILRVMEC